MSVYTLNTRQQMQARIEEWDMEFTEKGGRFAEAFHKLRDVLSNEQVDELISTLDNDATYLSGKRDGMIVAMEILGFELDE